MMVNYVPPPLQVAHVQIFNDDSSVYSPFLLCPLWTQFIQNVQYSVAKFIVSDWGDKVNPTPKSTISPRQGLRLDHEENNIEEETNSYFVCKCKIHGSAGRQGGGVTLSPPLSSAGLWDRYLKMTWTVFSPFQIFASDLCLSQVQRDSKKGMGHCVFHKSFSGYGVVTLVKNPELRLLGTHCKENPIYVFPGKKLRGLSPNFHIHASVSDLYILTIGPSNFLLQKRKTDCGTI